MKKSLFLAIILFSAIFSNAQTTENIAVNLDLANKVFNSYEDYIAKKPIEGVTLKWFDYENCIFVTENGVTTKTKYKNFKYQWFCAGDGVLCRVVDGDIYFVIEIGKLWFYAKLNECDLHYDPKTSAYNFYPSGDYGTLKEYYSEGKDGEMTVLKRDVWNGWLEKYGLKDQFEAEKKPKREVKDSVTGYENKVRNVVVKYKKLLNQKMK